MPTIIDSLLIELGLDTKGYKKGQKDAEQALDKFAKDSKKTSKDVSEQSKAMADGFKSIGREIVSVAGLALGAKGVKDFFESAIKGQANMARSSRFIGMTLKEMDGFGNALVGVGGKAENFATSIQGILGGFQEFKLTGQSSVINAFQALGLSADKFDKNKVQGIIDLADKFSKKSAQDQLTLGDMLHITPDMVNLLAKGGTEVGALFKQYSELSDKTEQSGKAAQAAEASWAKFKGTIGGISDTIFSSALPAFDALGKGADKLAKYTKDNKGGIAKFGENFAKGFSYVFGLDDNLVLKKNDDKPNNQSMSSKQGYLKMLEKKLGLPSGVLDSQWQQESGRGKRMLSSAGARGDFQIMPATANPGFGLSSISQNDTMDFAKSANFAANYMNKLMARYGGNIEKALQAYNGGFGPVDKNAVKASETLNYSKQIMARAGITGGSTSNTTTSSQVSIGAINVSSPNPDTSALDIKRAFQQNNMLQSVNSGMY
jgi:hypothetical protein